MVLIFKHAFIKRFPFSFNKKKRMKTNVCRKSCGALVIHGKRSVGLWEGVLGGQLKKERKVFWEGNDGGVSCGSYERESLSKSLVCTILGMDSVSINSRGLESGK
jgi:hypothetical protein